MSRDFFCIQKAQKWMAKPTFTVLELKCFESFFLPNWKQQSKNCSLDPNLNRLSKKATVQTLLEKQE